MAIINEWAIVTGASKGLGYQYCKELLKRGYNIVGVSRNAQAILNLKKDFPNLEIKAYDLDLSKIENAYKLYKECDDLNITLVINNAGYGVLGKFDETDLDQELNMLNLNICTLHALTKLYTQRFLKYNKGRVINIASVAAFVAGPGFSSYFASKSYVLRLGVAINTELKAEKSKVRLVTICPGTLKTDFWVRSGAVSDKDQEYKAGVPSISVDIFAKKSLNKALKTKSKNFILLGFWNHLLVFVMRLIPKKILLKIIYKYRIKH